jgi:hypothetical protein
MEERARPYLERDVFITEPDLQLLPAILVLLRPFAIVFPIPESATPRMTLEGYRLHDLAVLDDSLDLRDHQRANAHCRFQLPDVEST